jgi:hypothetical protein
MKKILITLAVVFAMTPLNVMASGEIVQEKGSKDYKREIEIFELTDETLGKDTLSKTYTRNGIEGTSIIIDIPIEIMEMAKKEKNKEKQIQEVYRLMTIFYVQTDSYIKLNTLFSTGYENVIIDEIKIAKDMKKRMNKNIKVAKSALEDETEGKIIVENEEMYIATDVLKEVGTFLPIQNEETAKNEIKMLEKELKTTNVFLIFSILTVFIGIVLMIFKKRKE